jgi:hypothetical protein
VELFCLSRLYLRISYFNVASNLFDLLAYMHHEVLVASFLALWPRVDSLFPGIISWLEKTEIIITAISTFYIGIVFALVIVSQSSNCSQNLVAEYLAVSDDFVETFFCQSGFERLILGDFPK